MGMIYIKYLEWILAHSKSIVELNSLFTWHQARQNRQQQRNSSAPCECLHCRSKKIYQQEGFVTFRLSEQGLWKELQSPSLIWWSWPKEEVSLIYWRQSKQARLPFSPGFCVCAGRMCYKAMSFNLYSSLAPRFSVGILKHGPIGVPKEGYIPFLLPAKDSCELKQLDGYILLCFNNIWFCCF